MDSFRLDDVRDFFSADARTTMATASEAAAAMAIGRSIPERGSGDGERWSSMAEAIHCLKGSAAMVGLSDIAAVAARLEDGAEAAAERARQIDALVVQQAECLAAARAQLAELRRGIDLALGAPPDSAAEAAESPSLLAGAEELLQLFASEVAGMADQMRAEAERADDPEVRRSLARRLHMFKGSASVVGLTAIAEQAAALEDGIENGAAAAAAVPAAIERLLDAAGVPAASAAAVAANDDSAIAAEIQAVVRDEAQELIERLERTAQALSQGAGVKPSVAQFLRDLHTLKGALSTAGWLPAADAAHRIESAMAELPIDAISGQILAVRCAPLLRALRAAVQRPEERPDGLAAALAALAAPVLATAAPPAARAAVPEEGAGSATGGGSTASASGAGSHPIADEAGAGLLRVDPQRIEALMDRTGELVGLRSRVARRVDDLRRFGERLRRDADALSALALALRTAHESAPEVAASGPAGGLPEIDRYDSAALLVRRLETVNADLMEAERVNRERLGELSGEVDLLGSTVLQLQEAVTRTRLVPIETIFTRLRLPILEAAAACQRGVDIDFLGGVVGIDKSIADRLIGPLLHLVRNAVVHGIEAEEARLAAGKPARGRLSVSARQDAANLVIEVADDGRGLDLAALREAGVRRRLIPADVPLGDPRLPELVFVPGLTTRASADHLSGRGVGCDAVRQEVETMGGAVRVRPRGGGGTVFTVMVPVTLAVSRVLIVRQDGELYCLPLAATERVVDLNDFPPRRIGDAQMVAIGDAVLELRPFAAVIGAAAASPPSVGVVVRLGDRRAILAIDSIVAQDDVVVKRTGLGHEVAPLFSGAALDADGAVMLILDPGALVPRLGHAAADGGDDGGGRPAEQPAATAPAGAAAAAPAAPARILVVDDSLSVRRALERYVQSGGWVAVGAADGVEALERLEAGDGGGFDLIFTDLEMPRLHGFDLLRRLQADARWRSIPAVVVSSRSSDRHRSTAEELGAVGFLVKPFTEAQVHEHVVRLTRQVRA